MNIFMKRVSDLLASTGMTEKDLRTYLCTPEYVFNEWKAGKSVSYLKEIDAIAEFFNITVNELLDDKNNTETKSKTICIIATEVDGTTIRNLPILIRILNPDVTDVRKAIEQACDEWIRTEDGKKTYSGNCHCFNWADFDLYVPNDVCRKYGFEKTGLDADCIGVDWDEQLVVDDDSFYED